MGVNPSVHKLVEEYGIWFLLAREFGQDPWEIQLRWTHRQFMVALQWLRDQWENPDRTDYYLMQIAAEVRRGNAKNPRSVDANDFKMKFRESGRSRRYSRRNLTREQAASISKATWMMRLGMLPAHNKNEPDRTS